MKKIYAFPAKVKVVASEQARAGFTKNDF